MVLNQKPRTVLHLPSKQKLHTFEFKGKKIMPSKQKSHDCHCICVMPVQLTSKITNNFMEVDYNVRIVNINADRNSSTSILKLQFLMKLLFVLILSKCVSGFNQLPTTTNCASLGEQDEKINGYSIFTLHCYILFDSEFLIFILDTN